MQHARSHTPGHRLARPLAQCGHWGGMWKEADRLGSTGDAPEGVLPLGNPEHLPPSDSDTAGWHSQAPGTQRSTQAAHLTCGSQGGHAKQKRRRWTGPWVSRPHLLLPSLSRRCGRYISGDTQTPGAASGPGGLAGGRALHLLSTLPFFWRQHLFFPPGNSPPPQYRWPYPRDRTPLPTPAQGWAGDQPASLSRGRQLLSTETQGPQTAGAVASCRANGARLTVICHPLLLRCVWSHD